MINLTIPYETISFGNNSIQVRGISVNDITILIQTFGFKTLDDAVKEFTEKNSDENSEFDLMDLLTKFPLAAAHLIALAADSSDQAGLVARMPAPAQIQCLEAIYKLTIQETGGLESFILLIRKIMRGIQIGANSLKENVAQLKQEQQIGI